MSKTLIIIALSAIMGAAPTWYLMRRSHLEFVAEVERAGNEAKAKAETIEESNRLAKKAEDNEYETRIAAVRSDAQRLLNARSSGGYVPIQAGSPEGAGDVVCFGRAELNAAIGQLDAEISEFAESGDDAKERMNATKKWWDSVVY